MDTIVYTWNGFLRSESIFSFLEWGESHASPLTWNYPCTSYVWLVILVPSYLLLVFIGRTVMEKRPALNLVGVKRVHNVFLCALSAYVLAGTVREALRRQYKMIGNPVESSEAGQGMADMIYLFYVSKIIECVDTVLIVGMKRFRQFTFLHVFHHTITLIWLWFAMRFAPGGDAYFGVVLNSFIHVLMYAHYFVSTFIKGGWWRKYLTRLQITQCVYSIWNGGPYPVFFMWALMLYTCTLFVLFLRFYRRAYLEKQRQAAEALKKE